MKTKAPLAYWLYIACGGAIVCISLSGLEGIVSHFSPLLVSVWAGLLVALYRRQEWARLGLIALGVVTLLALVLGFHRHPYEVITVALEWSVAVQTALLLLPSLRAYAHPEATVR